MAKLKKCTIGTRHKWDFIKNVQVKTQTMYTMSLTSKAKYKCACGVVKYGEHNPNG